MVTELEEIAFIDKLKIQGRSLSNYKINGYSSLCLIKVLNGNINEYLHNIIEWLHPNEIKYVKQLHYDKRIQSYLIGRIAAKYAINYLTSTPMNKICLTNGLMGQPIINNGDTNLQISISHCQNIGAALTFQESFPMGIDIEYIQGVNNEPLKCALNDHEKQLLQLLDKEHEDDLLTAIWSAKEAIAKLLKTGFTISYDVFAVNKLELHKNYFKISFNNFPKYEVMAIKINTYIFSIAYFQNMEFLLPVTQICQIEL
jgi:phosphopantetheinyl transferase